jgi:hypothetical protein
MKFDFSSNIIIPGSLQLDNFEKAQIPHYKNPGIAPRQQVALIVGNTFDALMLKTPMLIQACIPSRVANQSAGNIEPLMQALKTKSDWILISKTTQKIKQYQNILST